MPLSGQVALVIGLNRPSVISQLARQGATIALHPGTSSRIDDASRIRDEMAAASSRVRVTIHSGDLGSATGVQLLFADIVDKHNRIDFVVNEAGQVLRKPITQLSETERSQMLSYLTFVDAQALQYNRRLQEEHSRQYREED